MVTYLRMSLRVPMQSGNCFSMVRVSVRGRASLLFKIGVWVSLQSEFSNDQVENSFQSDCGAGAISHHRILRRRFAVCELAYIHSKRFLAGVALVGTIRAAQAIAAMSVVEGRADQGRAPVDFRK